MPLTLVTSGEPEQILLSDGSAYIRDAKTGTAFTTAGTPTTASLLGATAPKIGAAWYTDCHIATPFAAGSALTFLFVVNTAWAGDDGVNHYLWNTRSATEYVRVYKSSTNLLTVILLTPSGNKSSYIAVDGVNWAAGTHIVIATIAANGSVQIWLDGISGAASTSLTREVSWDATSYLGTSYLSSLPVEGAILGAIYDRELDAGEIAAMFALAAWNTLAQTTISIIELETGNAVRAYDSLGNLLAGAVESGGTATIDLSASTYPTGKFKGYVNVYQDSTYARVIDSCSRDTFWGGDACVWTAPTPPTPAFIPPGKTRRKTRKPLVKVFDCTGANLLKVVSDYKDLSFETDLSSGYSIAGFTIGRNPLKIYEETEPFNQVVITDGAETCWEGFVDEPRGDADGNIEMACVGWVNHLNRNACVTNQAPQTMATFIGSTMLADAAVNVYIVLGSTTWPAGYTQYTVPAQEDIAPGGKFYTEILDAYARYGGTDAGAAVIGGRWMIWAKKAIYYQPIKTTPDWIIRASECPGFACTPSPKNYWNRVYYSYSPTGSAKVPGMVEDTVSQGVYGGRVVAVTFDIPGRCSASDALQAATVKLKEGASMVIIGQFRTRKLYDAVTLVEVDPWRAKAGDLITAIDLKTGLGTLATRQTSSVITTFEVKSTKYYPKMRENEITPVNDDASLAASLAIFERRTAMN